MRMRFFRYGELPLVLLALLEREALNGYELMGELNRHFSPRYVASAGSVYPALNAPEAEGLIEALGDETPKRFKLARAGTKALTQRRYKLSEVERRTDVFVSRTDAIDEGARAVDRRRSSGSSAHRPG
jgi:DNA-binding PadR family transcriptional regulator